MPCGHTHQGKLHDALATCRGSLPPFTCVTEPVSDGILCLLQGQDGPHGESSALAAAAVTGLAGQQHCRAGLPSKQLQSQGELQQDQGKSFLSWICDVLHNSSFQATKFGIQ